MTNRLFPIALCGSGSAEVESLPSYIHRLAFKYGIYVGELLRFVVRQAERDEIYQGKIPALPRYIHVHDILRRNTLASGLIEALEYLTRQSLQGATVSIFNGPLTMSRGELHKGFRWCPECLGEMAMMGEEPYFKLIWQFRAVLACPVHRSPFLDKCDHCGCDQTSYVKRRPLGRCQDCGKPLSARRRKLKTQSLSTSWQDIGRDVLGLLADLDRYGYSSVPADGVFRSLDQLFDHYWRQNREEDFYQLLDRDQLLSILYGKKALCLNAARKVAFGLGISLYDLISGNAAQTSAALDFGGFCPLPPSFMETSERFTRDHESILRKLRLLAADDAEPLSLKATATKLGTSVGYLEYRFPLYVKNITARYQHFKQVEHLKKLYLAQKHSLEYFLSESEGSGPKSRKQAYRLLRKETGLPKWLLKKAIQVAYHAMS